MVKIFFEKAINIRAMFRMDIRRLKGEISLEGRTICTMHESYCS